jgi:type II secretory pathway component PulF
MPLYQYTARDTSGQTTRGQLEAASNSEAVSQLRERGLWVMDLKTSGGAPSAPRERPSFSTEFVYPLWSGVNEKEKSLFYRQLYSMVGAGMPLYQAITTLGQQASNPRLKAAMAAMAQQILAGGRLSEAMARFRWIFSALELRMIEGGEIGGLLESVFQRLAEYLEREWSLRLQIKQRTLYPKLLALAVIFIPSVPTLVLAGPVPYFAGILRVWLPIAIGCILLWVAIRYMLKGQAFRDFYDQLKLIIPVTEPLVRKMAVARFARALAALYHAGVPIMTAVAASGEASGNAVLQKTMIRVVPAIERGGSLTQALMATGFFPPMVTGMIATGEQTGDLDSMLDKVAEYYENESTHATMQLVVILGVVLLLIMAIIIAVQVIGFWTSFYGGVSSAGQ